MEQGGGNRIPHTRGDGPLVNFLDFQFREVFPTRVGMDRGVAFIKSVHKRIPHTRGDGPFFIRSYAASYNVFPTRVGMDHYR